MVAVGGGNKPTRFRRSTDNLLTTDDEYDEEFVKKIFGSYEDEYLGIYIEKNKLN